MAPAYEALTKGAILVSRGPRKPAYHAGFSCFMEPLSGILHVAHGEVVVEVVVEIERLLHVFGIVIGDLDARLLPPE